MEITAENSHAEKLDKCLLRMYNNKRFAGVLELADETDSKSVVRKDVWVQVPPPAPQNSRSYMASGVFHVPVWVEDGKNLCVPWFFGIGSTHGFLMVSNILRYSQTT